MKTITNIFESIISPESLFAAWDEFKKGKSRKVDVLEFERDLESHIFQLHRDLRNKRYKHGPYHGFYITDPKVRHIHKALVRDRIVHHALFKVIYAVFEPTFIPDSFSCRLDKGTHKGVARVQAMIRKVSKNGTAPCYALKCDIQKFFDSVDHATLLTIIQRRIKDHDVLWLLQEIITSYTVLDTRERERERERVNDVPKGIPIGNLTSQVFANIYMNEFDQFMKHDMKVKNYARYTDDFVVISNSRLYLERLLPSITSFLEGHLALSLHPEKVSIQPFHRGVDFLGYVFFPQHLLLRTRTRRRMFKKLSQRMREYEDGVRTQESFNQSLNSYLGVLSHANAYTLTHDVRNRFWVPGTEEQ